MNTKSPVATGAVCNPDLFQFPAVKKRAVGAGFTGGEVASDGGLPLLRQTARRIGLTKAPAKTLPDARDPQRIEPPLWSLARQRIYGLAQGYADLNDHDALRQDLAWPTAVARDAALASSPTLCRLEKRAARRVAGAVQAVIVEQCPASFAAPPGELVLDFDSTDDRGHGQQEGRFFHGYYGAYCFLPLHGFCGEQWRVSHLRPAHRDAARQARAVWKLLVQGLRAAWPQVRLIFRGDSGFCRWRLRRWCEDHEVKSIVGLAKNAPVRALGQRFTEQAQKDFQSQQQRQRLLGEVKYAADPGDQGRRGLVQAEHADQGGNPRFGVTNLEGEAPPLDDQ